MSLESPITYAEWYWKHSVDARKAFDESVEQAVSPYFKGVLGDIPDLTELPSGFQTFVHALSEPPSPGLGGFLVSAAGEFTAEILREAIAPAMAMLKRSSNRRSRETWLTAQQAVTLSQRKKITDEYFYLLTASEGYEDIAADSLYTSLTPYPAIPEIMTWARYHGDFDNVRSTVWEKYDVPADDFQLWEWLSWQKMTTVQAQSLFKRGTLAEPDFMAEIGRIGWHAVDRAAIKDLSYVLPNSMLLVQAGLVTGSSNEQILADISRGDIHPDYAQKYLDAVLTKPASQDIVAYALRNDPGLSSLPGELQRIGIHPAWTDIYKELAYQIPPVADIITMAVREAFTPSIAARFGQYEDFPPDLEKYAGQKGLSSEWAQRYWAAHWSLPSPQQGFEMLHRGVISVEDLNTLLRASDVMPFWRDKLTAIAYRPLTRVDVRRMYREGVLDEREVFEAYKDHGYSDENAEKMTEFTVSQTLSSLSKFTSSDIVKAFTARMIDQSTAMSLLRDIGIRNEDAQYIITTAEYKRQWAFTDDRIAGVRNLYKKRVYDENAARDSLGKLNLPSEQVNVLMEQWYFDKVEELDATWTTGQTVKFFKRKLISLDRAKRELNLNGYNNERAEMILSDALWTAPKT